MTLLAFSFRVMKNVSGHRGRDDVDAVAVISSNVVFKYLQSSAETENRSFPRFYGYKKKEKKRKKNMFFNHLSTIWQLQIR